MAITGLRMSIVNPLTIEVGPGTCTTLSGGTITLGSPIQGTCLSSPQNVALAVWLTDAGKGPALVFQSDFENPPDGNTDSRRIGVVFIKAMGNLIRFTQTGMAETRTYAFAGSSRPRTLVYRQVATTWTAVPRPWLVPLVIKSFEIEAELQPGGALQGAVRGVADPSQILDLTGTGYGVDSFSAGTGADILEFISPNTGMTITLLGVTDEL